MSLLPAFPEDPSGDWPGYDPDIPPKPAYPWPDVVAAQRRTQIFSEADTWRWAEQDYGEGMSAKEVCDFYNLSRSTFTKRARREGFRRLDRREHKTPAGLLTKDPQTDLRDIEPPAAPPTPDMADLAWRYMAEALQRGDALAAQRWMKLSAGLTRHAKEAEVAAKSCARMIERGLIAADAEPATDTPDTDTPDTDTDDVEGRTLRQKSEAGAAPVYPHPDPLPQAGEGEDGAVVQGPLAVSSPEDRARLPDGSKGADSADLSADPYAALERMTAVMLARLEARLASGEAAPEIMAVLEQVRAQQADLAESRRQSDADHAEAEALMAELARDLGFASPD